MRASVIAILVFIGLIGLGVRGALTERQSRAHAYEKIVVVENDQAKIVVNDGKPPKKQERTGRWRETATGEFKSSSPEAVDDALRVAAEKAARRVRNESPPIEWTPSSEFVRKHMVRGVKEEPYELKDSNAPPTVRAIVEFECNDDVRQLMREEERKSRVEQRMSWLARIAGGIVLILVAIAGYIRLDDVTKGYYSIPLRIFAVTLGLLGVLALAWSIV